MKSYYSFRAFQSKKDLKTYLDEEKRKTLLNDPNSYIYASATTLKRLGQHIKNSAAEGYPIHLIEVI